MDHIEVGGIPVGAGAGVMDPLEGATGGVVEDVALRACLMVPQWTPTPPVTLAQ